MQLDSLAQTLLSATVPTAIWRFAIPTRNRVAPATLFSALPVCRCIDIGSPQQRITDKPANAEVPEAFSEQSLQVFPESVTGKFSWLRLRTKGCD